MDFVIAPENIKRVTKSYNNITALSNYTAGVIESKYKTDKMSPHYLYSDTLLINFNNLQEVFRLCEETANHKAQYNSSQEERSSSWTVYKTYDEALKVFKQSPHEVAKFSASDIVITDYQESGNAVDYDVTGDFIDIGRYLDGVPEMFGSMRQGNYRGVRVKIIMSGGSRASTDVDVINERGKRVVRLIDWLENQGIRVSFNVVFSNDNGHFDIKIKDYSDPLNIFDVAVATHGDFFRRMIFKLEELSKTLYSGYGSATSFNYYLTETLANYIENDNLDCMLVGLPSNSCSVSDVTREFDDLEKSILDKLEQNDYKQYLFSR